VKHSIFLKTNLLGTYSHGRQHTKAIQLIEKVEEEGLELSSVYCNVVIDTYGFMEKPDHAEGKEQQHEEGLKGWMVWNLTARPITHYCPGQKYSITFFSYQCCGLTHAHTCTHTHQLQKDIKLKRKLRKLMEEPMISKKAFRKK